ncbi:MAG: type II toxin-antitoxin system HicA family toxin [Chloroflexi bacterium]|nr:type II toxin-antitoxin system HicA family toxin [Chloroflexota bacterium]
MTYGELKRRLRRLGVRFRKQGKRHEVWERGGTDFATRIPRHRGEVPPGTLRAILRELAFSQEDLDRV